MKTLLLAFVALFLVTACDANVTQSTQELNAAVTTIYDDSDITITKFCDKTTLIYKSVARMDYDISIAAVPNSPECPVVTEIRLERESDNGQ